MAASDDVKSKVSLVGVAAQTVTWDRVKSRPAAGDFWASCPFHAEASASMHITERAGSVGQFFCFGCSAKGSVIDWVMLRDGVDFADAVRMLAKGAGLSGPRDPARDRALQDQRDALRVAAEERAAERAEDGHARALRLWSEAVPDPGPVAEYLTGRGVRLGALGGVPPTLRYHPDVPCYLGAELNGRARVVHRGPAMIAFIGRDRLVGVHRTWIDGPARARLSDGSKVPKQMLGRTGDIQGRPCVLTPRPGPVVLVGEGIETTLAALSAVRLDPSAAAIGGEAALTLGALTGPAQPGTSPGRSPRTGKPLPSPLPDFTAEKPGWVPPAGVRRVIILADPSGKDPDAARLNAARALAKIAPHAPDGAKLAIPLGRWDHDEDFADLAKRGALYD